MVNTINDFIFTPIRKSAFENFTIVDDDVLEFDELFIAEFDFGPEIANNWNARKGEPSIAFIIIRDDDCELCQKGWCNSFGMYTIIQIRYFLLFILFPLQLLR